MRTLKRQDARSRPGVERPSHIDGTTGSEEKTGTTSRISESVTAARLQTVHTYGYQDAATVLADFREMVDAILKERGLSS